MSSPERKSLVGRRPRGDVKQKTEKQKTEKLWKFMRSFGLFLTFAGGALLTIRVFIDGRVSFYGTLFKLLSMVWTFANFACDPSLSRDARVSYGAPKAFGAFTTLFSLIGIIANDYDGFYKGV
jgi:hypothetical protein